MRMSLLFLVAMELLELSAGASLIAAALGLPLPLLTLCFGYLLALGMGALRRGRGVWSLGFFITIPIVAAADFAFVFSALRAAALGIEGKYPEGAAILLSILAALLSVLFLALGFHRGFRPLPDHEACVEHFDGGAIVFLAAFLLSSPAGLSDPWPGRFAIPWLLASALALGSARLSHAGGSKPSSAGKSPGDSQGAVALVGLAFALVCFAGALAFLAPLLVAPAVRAQESIGSGLAAFLAILGAFLDTIFAAPRGGGPAMEGFQKNLIDPERIAKQGGPFAEIFIIVMIWTLAVAALVMVAVMFARSLKGRQRGPRPLRSWAAFALGIGRLLGDGLRLLSRLASRLVALFRPRRDGAGPAAAAYARLLAGGRAVKAGRRRSETPGEYGARLRSAFPRSARDAAFIITMMESEVYGGRAFDPGERRALARAAKSSGPAAFRSELLARAFRRGRRSRARP